MKPSTTRTSVRAKPPEPINRGMVIYGVALLAICNLVGAYLGQVLGVLLHVKSDVGGVGIAMMLLIAARVWLNRAGQLTHGVKLGIEFWAALYIPIVVAMAATQNVVAAVSGGPVVLIAAIGTVVICFGVLALIGRFGRPRSTEDPAVAGHAAQVLSGDAE